MKAITNRPSRKQVVSDSESSPEVKKEVKKPRRSSPRIKEVIKLEADGFPPASYHDSSWGGQAGTRVCFAVSKKAGCPDPEACRYSHHPRLIAENKADYFTRLDKLEKEKGEKAAAEKSKSDKKRAKRSRSPSSSDSESASPAARRSSRNRR